MQGHAGNVTDQLWSAMGVQVDPQGVERHGQSCFLYVHPNGTDATKAHIADIGYVDSNTLIDEGDGQNGPIDAVAQHILDTHILCKYFPRDEDADIDIFEYDGHRVGAGWIYAALLVARQHGCTQATVGISSNDGNLQMQAWDRKLGACVTAVHHTYYGT